MQRTVPRPPRQHFPTISGPTFQFGAVLLQLSWWHTDRRTDRWALFCWFVISRQPKKLCLYSGTPVRRFTNLITNALHFRTSNGSKNLFFDVILNTSNRTSFDDSFCWRCIKIKIALGKLFLFVAFANVPCMNIEHEQTLNISILHRPLVHYICYVQA